MIAATHAPLNTDNKPVLSLQNISKSFPGVKALQNVSFSINTGEVHALLGENGAGKSTLIKIISGVYQPDSNPDNSLSKHKRTADDTSKIQLDGITVNLDSPRTAQKHGIATIYQELLLYPELSVAENIFMGHAPRTRFGTLDWTKTRQLAREQLASLDIHDLHVDQQVGSLSVGNRQRVEIAKALSQNARILIMDEPTAALTGTDVERLFRIVDLLRQRDVGVIYISHRLEEIFTLADRVTVLRDGATVGTRDVSDTTEDLLINMMVGRTISELYPKQPSVIGAPVLELENVTRAPLTKSISLCLRRGEILGLAGLVGSGRSELAQTIFGITPAQSGKIIHKDRPVSIKSPAKAVELGIAYVPEDRSTQGLIREMRISENTSMAVLKELSNATLIDTKAEQLLADQSIKKFAIRASSSEQLVEKLSGGNQQKVVLGKWMASRPEVLIMDEPTRGIDVGAKAEIHRLMSELACQGMAVLMISSELPEIMGMSDTIAVMREGELVATFDAADATQEQIASAMMGSGTTTRTAAAGDEAVTAIHGTASSQPGIDP